MNIALSSSLLLKYGYERTKRGMFQYQTIERIKWSKSETSLNRGKRFVKVIREILDTSNN